MGIHKNTKKRIFINIFLVIDVGDFDNVEYNAVLIFTKKCKI